MEEGIERRECDLIKGKMCEKGFSPPPTQKNLVLSMQESDILNLSALRSMYQEVMSRGVRMINAPVSGGSNDCDAWTLTFMVGGESAK